MKTQTAAVLALLAALTLTGCAGTPDSAGDERTAPAATETVAPLTAKQTEEAPVGSTDDAYLVQLREALAGSGGNSIPDATDEQLIQAGHDACSQMTAGTELTDVRVIEDEPMSPTGYKDSIRIAAVAAAHFCTEHHPGG